MSWLRVFQSLWTFWALALPGLVLADEELKGYLPETQELSSTQPHTISELDKRISEDLGAEFRSSLERNPKTEILVLLGTTEDAKSDLQQRGWRLTRQIQKRGRFPLIYEALTSGGEKRWLLAGINGQDRLIHLQAMLKLAGVPDGLLTTAGSIRSRKAEYLAAFRREGYVPDGLIYGWTHTALAAVLGENKLGNVAAYGRLLSSIHAKRQMPSLEKDELEGFPIQILELKNGKKLWLAPYRWGDQSRDILEAAAETGIRNITFIGTAGSFRENDRVGTLFTPRNLLSDDGELLESPFLAIRGIPMEGTALHVPSPLMETQTWLRKNSAHSVDFVEVELQYLAELKKPFPDLNARAVLVVSDVLQGNHAQDLTHWSAKDARALQSQVLKVLNETLAPDDPDPDFRVSSLRQIEVPRVAVRPKSGTFTQVRVPIGEIEAGQSMVATENWDRHVDSDLSGTQAATTVKDTALEAFPAVRAGTRDSPFYMLLDGHHRVRALGRQGVIDVALRIELDVAGLPQSEQEKILEQKGFFWSPSNLAGRYRKLKVLDLPSDPIYETYKKSKWTNPWEYLTFRRRGEYFEDIKFAKRVWEKNHSNNRCPGLFQKLLRLSPIRSWLRIPLMLDSPRHIQAKLTRPSGCMSHG